jgi:O-methyltransferase
MMKTFDEAHALIKSTLVDAGRLKELWDTALACAPLGGAIVEVGVYRGGTAQLLREAAPRATLYLFDTFAGHPGGDRTHDHPNHHAGRFDDTSYDAVAALFDGYENRPVLVKGCFPDSLEKVIGLQQVAFVHVDVDLYEGTLAAFERFWPLLNVGGAMVCDDYGFDDCPGAKRAVREFVARTPGAELVELKTLQARVWKREVET